MKRSSFGLLLFVMGACSAWMFWPGFRHETVTVDVFNGTTAHQVGEELKAKGALHSKYPFLFWAKIRRGDTRIKIGRYQFPAGRSAYWIVDDLVKGRTQKITVVIPEGFASWQIAERLEQNQICPAGDFLKIVRERQLEGFLFPATYQMDLGHSAQTVVDMLTAELDRHWLDAWTKRAADWDWTRKETLTFASILEREVKQREELPLVSALYHNRLKKNMPLEADPTVQYALGYWKSPLLYRDYRETKSSYNTYLNRGLPPGPICNPGEAAIRAALWPGQTDALYMVAAENGFHDFSRTYRDHVNKVNRRNRRRNTK